MCNSLINQSRSGLALVIGDIWNDIFDDHSFPSQPVRVFCHTYEISIIFFYALKDFLCVTTVEVVGIFEKRVLLYDPLL